MKHLNNNNNFISNVKQILLQCRSKYLAKIFLYLRSVQRPPCWGLPDNIQQSGQIWRRWADLGQPLQEWSLFGEDTTRHLLRWWWLSIWPTWLHWWADCVPETGGWRHPHPADWNSDWPNVQHLVLYSVHQSLNNDKKEEWILELLLWIVTLSSKKYSMGYRNSSFFSCEARSTSAYVKSVWPSVRWI